MNSQMSENPANSNQATRHPHVRLSSLLLLTTICAILFAWFVDHRKLRSQIVSPQSRIVTVYKLSNASPARVVDELQRLYPRQTFVPAATGNPIGETDDNAVIVSADMAYREQIEIIIKYFDRKNTDMVKQEQ